MKILVSFSGGKTSAYMAHLMKERMSEHELLFVFANTGQEREETLEFVEACDKHFELGVVWVEAETHLGEQKACTHKVVDFNSASRQGEPFVGVIEKYGIPNKAFPHCTRELKANPIKSYAKSVGWSDCVMAIGIRADEPNRIGRDPKFIYPMNDWMLDKIDVNNFWEAMPFNLNLREHEGNCSWCWKKSDTKHFMLIETMPHIYEFPRRMEAIHGFSGAGDGSVERKFFRRNRSTDDLFEEYELIATDRSAQFRMFDQDEDSGCSESCEPFGEAA